MTSPTTGFPFLDDPHRDGAVVAMAHRGGAAHPDVQGLENTLFAFQAAVDLGYRYLETDVHATRDGVLLAFHDERLDRVTDAVGRIWELVHADVAPARVGGREPIPLLEDLLEAFPGIRFNIDLKSPGAVEPLARLVERTGAHDRVCVGSFTERSLRRFRSMVGRKVATIRGVPAVAAERFLPAGMTLGRAFRDPGAVYQVPVSHGRLTILDERFVARARAVGRHVHAWTIDDPAEMTRLLDLGVDGLITDRPDLLREVLQQRGQWWG